MTFLIILFLILYEEEFGEDKTLEEALQYIKSLNERKNEEETKDKEITNNKDRKETHL